VTKKTQIQLRVSEPEKAEIERRAKKHNKSVSDFLRGLALQGVDIPDKAEPSETVELTDEARAAAVEIQAKKIYTTEGVPMRVARQRAVQRLS
jgi:uncharacterized protein (DUF1778 family)